MQHYWSVLLYYLPVLLHYLPVLLHYLPVLLHYLPVLRHYWSVLLHYLPVLLHYLPVLLDDCTTLRRDFTILWEYSTIRAVYQAKTSPFGVFSMPKESLKERKSALVTKYLNDNVLESLSARNYLPIQGEYSPWKVKNVLCELKVYRIT